MTPQTHSLPMGTTVELNGIPIWIRLQPDVPVKAWPPEDEVVKHLAQAPSVRNLPRWVSG